MKIVPWVLIVIMGGLSVRAEDSITALHGFANWFAGNSTGDTPANQLVRGVGEGNIDFFYAPDFGSRLRALFELVLEPDNSGNATYDAERAQIGYDLAENTILWVGRFHTPLGQWNTNFHHGDYLQTTLRRPRFIEFEDRGGILPVHLAGFWVHSVNRFAEGLKFNADVYAANNPKIQDLQNNAESDLDQNIKQSTGPGLTFGANLALDWGEIIRGLRTGIHSYSSAIGVYNPSDYVGIANSNSPESMTQSQMWGGYFALERDQYALTGEYYSIRDKDLGASLPATNQTWNHSLYFIEAEALVTAEWRPYFMYEHAGIDVSDQMFSRLTNAAKYERLTMGVRYDFTERSALKFDFSQTKVNQVTEAYQLWMNNPARNKYSNFSYSTVSLDVAIRF